MSCHDELTTRVPDSTLTLSACVTGLVRQVCGDRALDAPGRHVAHGAGARGERRQSGRAGVRGHGGHRREEHGARSTLTHSLAIRSAVHVFCAH